MRLMVGTGIDDGDLAAAHDVADRTGKGEGARIVAQDAPHAGPHFLDHAGQKRKIAVEWNVVVGHFDCSLLMKLSCPALCRASTFYFLAAAKT
jgi:hypothetical protein